DVGPQPGDERLLLLLFGTFQFIEDRAGARRDAFVGVGAKALEVCQPQQRGIELPIGERLDDGTGPVGPADELAEGGLARLEVELGERRKERLASRRITCGSERINR